MTTGGPSAAVQQESVKEKRDLASWWKNFKGRDKKLPEQASSQGIFGIPLQASIRYANVAISLLNDEGQSYIYGYVPIVVAKCGVFLKEKATDVEGIFRLAGSEKRIKELKVAFDSPDRYGKGLDWTGYTVHDAANILRRYFNQLPEPIIPLEFYERFREPLKNHQQQAVGNIDAVQAPSEGEFDHEAAIRIYQRLITELPPLNRQLLLYILDLLAVFASKSDLNKMTTPNLAAIFQPGILNHPQHDMAPKEYRLSQDVLIFLIENQDSFLIGMQGTAADAETVRVVQSGSPTKPSTPTTPGRAKTVIARSGSNSSVGGESIRKWGSIRRNVSVSSKQSKSSEPTPPATNTAPGTPTNGVHRSNTVPSRRAASVAQSPRFSREKSPGPPTPPIANAAATQAAPVGTATVVGAAPLTVVPMPSSVHSSSAQATPVATTFPAPPEVTSPSPSEVTTPLATVSSDTASATTTREYQTPKKDTVPLLAAPARASTNEKSSDRSASNTPSTTTSGRHFLGILKQSPNSDGESRKPNKLQKRRIPGSALSSAHSSSHSLDEHSQRSPISPGNASSLAAALEMSTDMADDPLTSYHGTTTNTAAAAAMRIPQRDAIESMAPTSNSPPRSYHSQTDTSDADLVGDDMPSQTADQPDQAKRRSRWRLSRPGTRPDSQQQPPSTPSYALGNTGDQAMSRSTFGSAASQQRHSFQDTAAPLTTTTTEQSAHPSQSQSVQSPTSETVFSDSERERKGPMSWIRGKLQDRKEKDVERRSRTPERSHERSRSKQDVSHPVPALPQPAPPQPSSSSEGRPVRGQSTQQSRTVVSGEDVVTPIAEQAPAAPSTGLSDLGSGNVGNVMPSVPGTH